MKTLFLCLMLITLLSCAPVTTEPKLGMNTQIVSEDVKFKPIFEESDPEDFIKVMPDSPFILNSITLFERVYPEKVVSRDVSDFDYENGILVISTGERILTSHKGCSSLVLGFKPEKIELQDKILVVDSKDMFELYDLHACAKIYSYKKDGYSVRYSDAKVLIYKNRYFEVKNLDKSTFISGNLFKKIEKGHIYDNKVYLVDSDKNLVEVDLSKRIMQKPQKIENTDIIFYKDNYLFKDNDTLKKVSLKTFTTEIVEDKNYIIRGEDIYFLSDTFLKFFTGVKEDILKMKNDDTTFYILKNDGLKVIDIGEKKFTKKILFKTYTPFACRMGNIYKFDDIDGSAKYIDYEKETVLKEIEDFQCEEELFYKDGGFYSKEGKLIFTIATVVNENDKYKMLKREIDEETIYFYFDEKKL